MPADLLAHPDVVKAITSVLRGAGIARQDLPDAVAEVQVRILHSLRNKPAFMWPQTVDAWKALGIVAAQTMLKDRTKKATRRSKTDAGPVAEPDEHALRARRPSERDPLDQKLAVGVLAEHLAQSKSPEVDLEIVDRLQAGQDQAEMAIEMGLTHQQVRDRVRAIRKSFRVRLAGVVGSAAAAGFALLMMLGSPAEPRKLQAGGTPRAHAPDAVLAEASPSELAASLRDDARGVCRNGHWVDCLTLLDDARALDPAGDLAPEIQAARDGATQGVNDSLREYEAKPKPVPPGKR